MSEAVETPKSCKDSIGNELYKRAVSECFPEHQELMIEVWSHTPWMLDVDVGLKEDRRRQIRSWCNSNLGTESSPIHGNDGNWHEGGVTMNGRTWFGFKNKVMLDAFVAKFPNNQS